MVMAHSLHDIMNEVSTSLDTFTPAPASKIADLSELEAFTYLDPLLADLRKQYLDARQQRMMAEKDFGKNDGMADMARQMEDSAWCAMQTRYIEVRASRSLMGAAQKMMAQARADKERLVQKEKDKQALRNYERLQIFQQIQAAQDKDQAGLWLLVLYMMIFRNIGTARFQFASANFNRLAA